MTCTCLLPSSVKVSLHPVSMPVQQLAWPMRRLLPFICKLSSGSLKQGNAFSKKLWEM